MSDQVHPGPASDVRRACISMAPLQVGHVDIVQNINVFLDKHYQTRL
jgi:hypothetical protein